VVVEDGPTLTHGGMSIGAAYVAAKNAEAKIVDPRKFLVGSMKDVFEDFPQITQIVPAMGYTDQQIEDLEKTLNNVKADIILNGSPIDLTKLIKVNKPIIKVSYDIESIGSPSIEDILDKFIDQFLKK
ncbi:MAG: GTPase, partial [Promethearchaeota archaeon]